jgi:hypothetical protein
VNATVEYLAELEREDTDAIIALLQQIDGGE